MITEKCNLNCIYCYENRSNLRDMDFQIAVNSIDTAISNLQEKEEIEIDFHGGEPLIKFNLIDHTPFSGPLITRVQVLVLQFLAAS